MRKNMLCHIIWQLFCIQIELYRRKQQSRYGSCDDQGVNGVNVVKRFSWDLMQVHAGKWDSGCSTTWDILRCVKMSQPCSLKRIHILLNVFSKYVLEETDYWMITGNCLSNPVQVLHSCTAQQSYKSNQGRWCVFEVQDFYTRDPGLHFMSHM